MNGGALLLVLAASFAPQDSAVDATLSQLGATSVDELLASFPLEPSVAVDGSLKRLGEELLVRGDYAAAEALVREQLRVRTELFGEDDGRLEAVISNLNWILLRRGRYEEAVDGYERLLALALERHGADSLQVAVTRINLASAYQGVGAYDEVESSYLEALESVHVLEGERSPTAAVVAINLAVFLKNAGRLRDAEEHARRALELMLELHGAASTEAATARRLVGLVQLEQGRLDLAEESLRMTLERMRELEDDDLRTADALRYLGDVLFEKGDLPGAEACWRESLAIHVETYGPEHNETIGMRHKLGLCARDQGRLDDADELLTAAHEQSARMLAAGHPTRTNRTLNLALLRIDQGRLDHAAALCREVLEAIEAGGQQEQGAVRSQLAAARSHLGLVHRAAGEHERAFEELGAAVAVVTELHGAEDARLVPLLFNLAAVQEEAGELEASEATALRALALAESARGAVLGDELARARFAERLRHGELTALLTRVAVRRGDALAAFEYDERGRGRLLLELLARSDGELAASPELAARLAAEERARFAERAARRRLERAEEGERAARLEELREREAATRAAEAEVFAGLRGSWAATSSKGVEEMRAGLGDGTWLLSYAWTPRLVALLAVPPAGAGDVELFVLASEEDVVPLTREVEALARALALEPGDRAADLRERLRAAAARLLPAGARERCASAEMLVILPAGPLRSVPFDLLASGWPEIGGKDVVYAPSATMYVETSGARSSGATRFVGLGDPSFAEAGADSQRSAFGVELRPLPGTRAEVTHAARLFESAGGSADLLLGAAATRADLEAAADGATVLHLATHAVHGSSARPYDAALALTPEGEDGDGASGDFLTLDRLVRAWGGRLDGCELVVLSACATHHEVRAGASTLSLPWGFFYAGAPSVVATLWKVDDRATALLMARFHANRLGRAGAEPMSTAAALRGAREWLRGAAREDVRAALRAMGDTAAGAARSPAAGAREVDPSALRPYADPHYWAAFVLLGAPD